MIEFRIYSQAFRYVIYTRFPLLPTLNTYTTVESDARAFSTIKSLDADYWAY